MHNLLHKVGIAKCQETRRLQIDFFKLRSTFTSNPPKDFCIFVSDCVIYCKEILYLHTFVLNSILLVFRHQATNDLGVGTQTSFMFLTIAIVPILVSTIAFLPKSRIPWPLPATYGNCNVLNGRYSGKSKNSRGKNTCSLLPNFHKDILETEKSLKTEVSILFGIDFKTSLLLIFPKN